MRFLKTFIFILGLVVIAVFPAYSQREIPDDLSVTLERYPCFGWCPYYSLTIAANGTVKFTPLGQHDYIGKGEETTLPLTGTIDDDQIKVLLAEFRKIKFFSLRNRYGSEEKSKSGPSCPQYSTDSSSAKIVFQANGKRKTVSHYLGCHGAQILDDLKSLENKIDEVVNVKQWRSQFAWGAASVIDLKLQINPLKPTEPTKHQ